MYSVNVRCFNCNKEFNRASGQYNEAIKKNWNQFCSTECLNQNHRTGEEVECNNPSCNKRFYKPQNQINKTARNFCSRSCSALLHNLEKGLRNRRKCQNLKCNQFILSYKKFCSSQCQQATRKISTNEYKKRVVKGIKLFVGKHNRIPFKCELNYLYRPARIAFDSWNKAIKAAGFTPNKVKFTKKFVANDGHKCDSLAEKIIDDWLFEKNINHKIHHPYPENRFTVDFKVNDYWIEFFGLSGQHKRYDQLKKEKLQLAKQQKLQMIEIYPKDLFPKSKLNQLLNCLSSN